MGRNLGKKKEPSDKNRVMVFMGTPDCLNMLSEYLNGFKADVLVPGTNIGIEEAVNTAKPDLIIFDISHPNLDALESCRLIKMNPGLKKIPVIFAYPIENIKNVKAGYEAGGVDYLLMPFVKEEVQARVSIYLRFAMFEKKEKALKEKSKILDAVIQETPSVAYGNEFGKDKTEMLPGLTLDCVINALPDALFIKDRRHRLVALNDAFSLETGFGRNELIGKSDYDIYPMREADISWMKDEMVFSTGSASEYEEEVQDACGQTRNIIARKHLITDEYGDKYILGVQRDITERKQAERRLRDSEERFRLLYENIPAMCFLLDEQGTMIYINAYGAGRLGYGPEELLGKPITEIIHPEDRETTKKLAIKCLDNPMNITQGKIRGLCKDGSVLGMQKTMKAVRQEHGRPILLAVCEN